MLPNRLPTALLLLAALGCQTAGAPDTPPADGASAGERAEAAPVNASPTATLPAPPPEENAPGEARQRAAEPFVEPRSEWTVDDSINTPAELAGREILAKFAKDDGRTVIIYRLPNGDVYRRISGAFGAYTRVEESRIDLDAVPE